MVTGAGFIVLASALAATKALPAERVTLLAVDRFMSEARAITNGVVPPVIAKSEGELDEARPPVSPAGHPVAEAPPLLVSS